VIRWLLDTDHISLVERGHPALRTRLETVPPEAVAVSVVTVEETIRGRLAILSRRAPGASRVHAYAKLMETVRFYGSVPVVPFDEEVEREFETQKAQKIRIGSQDLRIAATARVRPAAPCLLKRLIAADRPFELFGKPYLPWHRLL
jgi:tRNA(fMet)-specific endonuclease VapC